MKLAFSRPTADVDEQRLLFSCFRRTGFEGLQLKTSQFGNYLDQPEQFRQDWGDDPGVVSGLITGGTLGEKGIKELRSVIRLAQVVNAEMIIFCHSTPREGVTAGQIREFARILSDLGEEAQERGVQLSLHHHYGQPVMYREDFDTFFDAVRAGAIGLTVDTAHLVKSGIEDLAEIITSFREVINNLHLKDFAGGEFQVLGRGRVRFDPVFAALREIGYQGWICADEESGADILSGMEESYRFLASYI